MCELPTVGFVVSGLVFLFVYTAGLEKHLYYTKDMCSKTITVYRSSSTTLSFSSGKTKVDFDDSCEVRVEGESSSDRLSFHFLFFDLDPFCEDSNLTVYDGDISASSVQGLPSTMCGHKSSLIGSDSPITSKQHFLTLLFLRNNFGLMINSSFKVEFTTYREEHSCSDTMPEYKCDNGRCIDKSLRCNEDLNPCGDHSDCKPETDEAEEREDAEEDDAMGFLRNVHNYLPIVGAIIGVFALYSWCKSQKREHGEYPLISRLFASGTLRGGNSRDQPAQLTTAPGPTSLPPPPSYDAALANQDVYTKTS